MFRRTLLFFILLFVLASQEHLYAQCYPAYSYSKKVSFRNTGSALTDFQVKVEVNTQELISAGQMLASGNDIRFTDASCNNLSYWIESGINTANTIIWVKVNSLAANAITILTMYYGNPSATAASNGAATFESFDDFESGALSGWTTIGASSWAIADYDGSKRLKGSSLVEGSGTAAVKYTGTLTDYAVEMDYLNDNSSAMGGPLFEYTDDKNYYAIHSMTAPDNMIMHSLITNGNPNYSNYWPYTHNNNIWYKWSIEHTGLGSAIYFNNQKIADLSKVYNTGAGVWGYGSGSAVIYFDNFRVRKLSPANTIERLTGPVVSSLNPATHTSDISRTDNLTMEFITDIKKGTGNITIYKADDNSIIEQISVNSSNVTISGSTVTIDPAADLPSQTEVYVLADAGTFLDLGDIPFAGISGMHTWMFETSITKIDQQISFAATNSVTYGDADFDPGATSDNSSIPVTYTSSNTAVATIMDGKVHILKAGATTITATQAGDATHNPAADQTQTLTIQPKSLALTLNATPLITKVYDGNMNAALVAGNYTISGVVGSDEVSASGTASYDTKQVGTGKTITVTNLALQGTDQSNYSLTITSAAVTGSITTKPITASLNTSPLITKEYDGNTSAVLAETNYTLSGILNNDDVKVSGTASYDNKNTGNSKTITVTSLALDGADKANYSLTTQSANTTGSISRKALMITADDKERFAGTPNPAFTESYSGFVSNEGPEVLITGPVLSTTATQASLMGEYPIEVSGADAANYEISYTAGTLTVKPGAPTAINFSQAVLPENKPAETPAGMLSSLSDDPSATFTFTLVSGDGDADNQLFTINGDKLISNASFNYEERSTYTVRVRSTTQYGLWLEKPVTVAITDVNEIPTLDQPEDKTLCFVNTQQTIALAGISAGPETNQATTLSVKSDNNALFESLTVSGTGATGEIRFTIKANVAGTALVSVKVKDNGGTEHDGTDEVVKTLRITVNPNPVFTINSEKGNKLSKGNSSQLTITGSDIASIQWSPSAGLNDPQNLNPVARPLSNTDYSVTATSAAGCTATGSISITVEDDLSVIAPKAIITPNGDGVNDRFVIENIDAYPNNRLQVFDRSGKLVYEKQNYTNNWDGKIQNRALVNDTYFYVLTVNGKVIKKGSVTIIK